MEDKKNLTTIRLGYKNVLVLIILIFCFGYLAVKATQAAYESYTSTSSEMDIAEWIIKLNDYLITDNSKGVLDSIPLNYSLAQSANGRTGKVGPGSTLTYPIKIDTTGTKVAVRFDIDIIDKAVEEDKYFTLKTINATGITLVQTSATTYTGVIPKNNTSDVINVTIEVEWDDDGSLVEYNPDSTDDSFIQIYFHAKQYNGETITPYNG